MEKIYLRTDRDLYLTGERVFFKLYTFSTRTNKPVHYSDIVYLELIDRRNTPLVQKKFAISSGESSGFFTLPFDLASDHYYVRAYTSWMKNAGANAHGRQLLTVLNPFGEILPEMIAADDSTNSDANIKRAGASSESKVSSDIEISVQTDKSIYGSREKAVLSIETKDKNGNPVEASLFLSVVRKGLLNSLNKVSLSEPDQSVLNTELLYAPEWGGHLIEGSISEISTGVPVSGDTLLFSVVGKKAQMDYSITDKEGRFSFLARNLEGLNEIVIQDLNPSRSDYRIILDDPYSVDYTDLHLPPFYLDTTHLMEINKAVISSQIKTLYTEGNNAENGSDLSLSFYGIPEEVIYLADYIRLPEMREVFYELIPDAQMRGRGDQTIIRAKNVRWGEYSFTALPLVLVDGVVTPDPMQVVAINAQEVDRIEVITSKYHYGVLQFPGIVSIFTTEGRCPVNFPVHYFRQAYDFISPVKHDEFPTYHETSDLDDPIPDYRNTMYWDPDIITDESGRASIVFYTSDDDSDYILMVQGFTSEGFGGACFDTISFTGRK